MCAKSGGPERPSQLSSNDNVVPSALSVALNEPRAPVTIAGTSLKLLNRATAEDRLLCSLASEVATTAVARTTGSTNCIDRILMGALPLKYLAHCQLPRTKSPEKRQTRIVKAGIRLNTPGKRARTPADVVHCTDLRQPVPRTSPSGEVF